MENLTENIITTTTIPSNNDTRLILKEQIYNDLIILLSQFNNQDIGLRLLSQKIRISEKTLKRIIKYKPVPHKTTIIKFYSYFFNVINDKKQTSSEFHNNIKINYLDNTLSNIFTNDEVIKIEKLLTSSSIALDLYLYSRSGVFDKKFVKEEYGNNGLSILNILIKLNVLIEIDKKLYTASTKNIIKGPSIISSVIQRLMENHFRPEKLEELGENHAFYAVEGVSQKTKDNLLQLSKKFYTEIVKIMTDKNNHGNQKVFLLSIVDNLKNSLDHLSN